MRALVRPEQNARTTDKHRRLLVPGLNFERKHVLNPHNQYALSAFFRDQTTLSSKTPFLSYRNGRNYENGLSRPFFDEATI
jgi:hypothetical protein